MATASDAGAATGIGVGRQGQEGFDDVAAPRTPTDGPTRARQVTT